MTGYAAIFLAFIATGLAAFFYLKAFLTHSDADADEKKGTLFYGAAAGMIFLAAGYLYYLILSDNFRYVYVFGYSSREQALAYKISAFWAGQEGSFLLWAVFHAVFGLLITRKKAPVALVTHCGLQLFMLLLLFVKSPFKALPEIRPDGIGLNPLLQDPWMVIHPPIVFLGYAALAVPFAWAIHGLLTGRHKEVIARALPWALFAWTSLGAGIFIGGFWAYKVLGWGGYWAWDPVENSSLVPWLVTGALLHLLLLARVRETALTSAYFTAIINFVLVLYGTYLTRSGVLSDFSTHSFSDEGGSGLLAGFVLITAVSGLIVWISRWSRLPDGPLFTTFKSREFCLFAAAVLLAAISVIVLAGMSTPLVTMLLESPYSVGVSFYNAACLPLAAVMVLLLTGGSSLTWGENSGRLLRKRWWLLVIALAAMIPTVAFGIRNFVAVAAVGLAVAAMVATALAIREKVLTWPAGLTHAGVAAALIGIIFSSIASHSVIAGFEPGIRQEVLGTGITYLGKQAAAAGRGFYQQFKLDDPPGAMLLPYTKQNKQGRISAREPGIYRGLTADIYLAPVMRHESGHGRELQLRKGEEASAEGIGVRFVRFGMDSGSSDIKAYALLAVTKDGAVQEVKPEVVPRDGKMILVPAKAFNRYEISLISFNISEGLAGIAVRDLMAPPKPEKIEVEISRKPLINLVWLGSIIITLGTGWAALARSRYTVGVRLGHGAASSDPHHQSLEKQAQSTKNIQ